MIYFYHINAENDCTLRALLDTKATPISNQAQIIDHFSRFRALISIIVVTMIRRIILIRYVLYILTFNHF